jgi:general stress protein 26
MSGDAIKKAIRSAKEIKKKGDIVLNKQEAITQGLNLLEKLNFCLLGTNGEDGFPNIKGMTNLKHEGLKKIWFSTNTSSKRVQQLRKNNRACVYYVDENLFKGLMLIGTIEILQDIESKKVLWTKGMEVYFPLGLEDPDYSVLCFTANQGNYFYALKNISFEIE